MGSDQEVHRRGRVSTAELIVHLDATDREYPTTVPFSRSAVSSRFEGRERGYERLAFRRT